MKNKNGFISMSLVYSFLVLFLFLMMSIINCYLKKNTYLEALDTQVSKDISITKDAKSSLLSTILEDNISIPSYTLNLKNISNNTVKNGNGLFYIDDKTKTDENNDGYGSKIYFFRGAVDNNYVVFAKEIKRDDSNQVSEEKSICWRILRTNEDGSIRLLYSGLQQNDGSCPTTGLNLDLRRLNNKYNSYADTNNNVAFTKISSTEEYKDNAYVGYTYGGRVSELSDPEAFMSSKNDYELYLYTNYHDGTGNVTSSNIKAVLDDYFLNHTNMYYSTELNYQPAGSTDPNETINMVNDRIANAIFCNDRNLMPLSSIQSPVGDYTLSIADPDELVLERLNKGYSYYPTLLEGYNRLWNGEPTYVCKQSIDRYTLRTISGGTNQNYNALSYAIGLPTLDEVIYAGGAVNKNNTGYFMKGDTAYWTMTPLGIDKTPMMATVSSEGAITNTNATTSKSIRPVISVNQEILVMSGNGLRKEPYILK